MTKHNASTGKRLFLPASDDTYQPVDADCSGGLLSGLPLWSSSRVVEFHELRAPPEHVGAVPPPWFLLQLSCQLGQWEEMLALTRQVQLVRGLRISLT